MKKIRLIGVYDYTVVLTYISLVITLVGISLAIEGSFRSAVFAWRCPAYVICSMARLREAKRIVQTGKRCLVCRSILCATASVLACFRQ